MSYFGLHLQTPIDEWTSELLWAAEQGKPYAVVKGFWVEIGKTVKQLSPETDTVYRYWLAHQQPFLDRALVSPAEADAAADQFIAMFKDSVNQHGNLDYVESLNETYPTGNLLAQRKAVAFDRAFIRRLRVHCPATRPIVYTAPPGNIGHDEYGVLIDLARECEAAGGAFGYHNYWSVVDKHSYAGSPGHARDYQMRWSDTLDAYLVARGIRVKYMLGESGPIGAGPDGYWQRPNDGWLLSSVWDGNMDGYISDLVVMDQLFEISRAGSEGRIIGATLFTSGYAGWDAFQVRQPLLGRLTDHIIDSTINPPPPPPPTGSFEEAAWNLTSEMQEFGQNGIRLNTMAGIQKQINADNDTGGHDLQVVTSETILTGKTIQAAECKRGTTPRRVYVWEPGQPIYYFENPVEIIDMTDELTVHPELTYMSRALELITTLTIHHTVTPSDFPVEAIAAVHVQINGWPGIGYHFVIAEDGTIYQTNHLITMSYHVGADNDFAVGIALIGDFTFMAPTEKQILATAELVAQLQMILPVWPIDIVGHREMPSSQTACPGATWDMWRGEIERQDELYRINGAV